MFPGLNDGGALAADDDDTVTVDGMRSLYTLLRCLDLSFFVSVDLRRDS